jgi:putative hydrolase of the HAD superfamily
MRYRAVIFDLFGTLVRGFARQEYDQVNALMAAAVGIPFSDFWDLVAETGHGWYSGQYSSKEVRLQDICRRWDVRADTAQIARAAGYHYEFMAAALIPEPEVLEALGALKSRGLRLGLITNCGPCVPLVWSRSPLARLIDEPVFSCEERATKPDAGIFLSACHRIQVQPAECVYVGDGSSEELTGAQSAGMLPVLKRADLRDAYDRHRPEVEGWRGLAIDETSELPDLLSGLELPS